MAKFLLALWALAPSAAFAWPTLDFPPPPEELPPYSIFVWNDSGWIDQNWAGGERSYNMVCMGNTLTVNTTNFAPKFVYIVPPEEQGGFQPPDILYNAPGSMRVGFGYGNPAYQPPGYPEGGSGTLQITADGALQSVYRYKSDDMMWVWVDWSELTIGAGGGTGTVVNRGYLNPVSELNVEKGSLQVYDGGRVVTTNLGVGVGHGTGTLLLSAPTGEVHAWQDLHLGHYIGTGTVSLVQGTLRVDGTNFVGRLSADGNLSCGSGTYTQTGGEAIFGTLILSSTSVDESQATLELGAGSLNANSLVVEGFSGKSVFRQWGGTAVFSNALIGPLDLPGRNFSGGEPNGGNLEVTGGSFATGNLLVRNFGAGRVLISNATVRVADSLRVGDDTAGGSLGNVEVWDGASVAVTNLIVGSPLGSGRFDHQGGVVTATTVRVSQGGYLMGAAGGTGATLRVTSDAGIRVVTGNTNVMAYFDQRGAVSARSLEVSADADGIAYYGVGANSTAALGDVLVSGVSSNLLLVHNGSLTSDRIRVAEPVGSRGYVQISGSDSQVQVTEFSCGSGTATVRQSEGTVEAGSVSMLMSNGSAGYWITGGRLQADAVSGVNLLGGRVVAGSFSFASDQGSNRQTILEANQVTAAGDLEVRELALGIAPHAASAATNAFGGELHVAGSMVVGRDHAASVTVSQPVHVGEDLDLHRGSTLEQASQYGTVTVDGVARIGADGAGSALSLRAPLTAGTLVLGTNASLADLSTEGMATLSFHNLAATNGAVNLDWRSPIRIGLAGQLAPGQTRMASGTLNARLMTVGQWGSASVSQEDGFVTLEQDLTLGMAGCTGSYALSNGVLTVQGGAVVGNSDGGTGVFHHVSGSHLVWGGLTVGKDAGSKGTYTLDPGSGWGSVNAGTLTVGESGVGRFVQNGGSVHVMNSLNVGSGSGSSGDYTMNGSADLRTMMLTVGEHGDAAFHQDGGTVTVVMNIQVGTDGGSALYELTSGTLDAGSAGISVGSGGTLRLKGGLLGDPTTRTVSANTIALGSGGVLEATGFNNVLRFNQIQNLPASFNFSGSLEMGNGMGFAAMTIGSAQQVSATTLTIGSQGDATLTVNDGAALDTEALDIGDMGYGLLVQNGGTVTVHGEINLGQNWVQGEYVQSAGTLSAPDAQLNVGAGNTGRFTISGGSAELGTVRVGGAGSGAFTVSGGVVRAESFHLDTTGTLAIQTNGELRANALTFDGASLGVSGTLSVGHDGGSGAGAAALGAGRVLSSRYLVVGQNAGGVFTQSGGSNAVTAALRVGSEAGSSGTYKLTGGTVSGPNTVVGRYGTGAFVQDGGTHRPDYLYLGYYAGSSGSYSLGGGALEAGTEFIGEASMGTFTQTGGVNTLTYTLYLGYESAGNGQYTLSSGSVAASSLYAGKYGTGTFTQSGGTVEIENLLYIAESTGSSGAYTLQGGSLSSTSEYVGYHGAGGIVQTGGTNTTLGLYLGGSANGTGTYLLSGNGDLESQQVFLGYGASGTFSQSGGVHNASWSLSVGTTKGKSGIYNLTGGELTSPGIYVGDGGSGLFHQVGGRVAATTLTLGVQGSGTGIVEVAGGAFEAGTLNVGKFGRGTLRLQNAGATITVSQKLLFGSNATFTAVPGSTIFMTGSDFQNQSTNAAAMAGLANLTLVFEGGEGVVDSFEVAGRDFGQNTNGTVLNFTLGALVLGGTNVGQVRLVDAFDNQPGWAGEEVLYVQNLTILPGSALDLNGFNLYYGSFTGDPAAVTLGGGLLAPIPEPGTTGLLLATLALAAAVRRHR